MTKNIDLADGVPPWEDETEPKQPEDQPDSLSEEEAHYYHTLISFEELVRSYGMAVIMDSIADDVYGHLFDYFMPPEFTEDNEEEVLV